MASTSRGQSTDEPDQKRMKTISPIKDAMQKIFVLEDIDVRQSGEGKSYGVTAALVKSTSYKQLHEVFVPGRLSGKFASSKKKFLLLKGFSQKEDGLIRISENSMVLDTQDTPIPVDILEKFTKPPPEDIAVIKTKSKGERVSVKGVIEKTTNVLETATSRRKIVTMRDSSATIEVKLWGQKIDDLNFQVDQTVLVTCLTVDVYGTKTSLNTNMSTTLEILNEQEQLEGQIEAACFDQDDLSIYVNDQLYSVNYDQMATIFPTMEFSSKKLTATMQGNVILDIISVGQEENDVC